MKTSRKISKQQSKTFKKKAKRLAAYSAAAAATVMTTQSTANAVEVVHDIVDVSFKATGPPAAYDYGVNFNMISGTVTEATTDAGSSFIQGSLRIGSAFFEGSIEFAGPAYSYGFGMVSPDGFQPEFYNYVYASPIDPNAMVGAGDAFGGNSGGLSYGIYGFLAEFDNATGFVGIRFEIDSALHYGWVQVTGSFDSPFGGTVLHGFGYNDTPGAASQPVDVAEPVAPAGDFNIDFLVNLADYEILRDNNLADLGTDPEAAALLGDIDGDLDNDIVDFNFFRNQYELFNGPGSFAVMVASTNVPEPSSVLLLAVGAAGLGAWRRRKSNA
jgi:hypothetical protein